MADYQISNDSELRERVRDLTGYQDNDDELPKHVLDGVVDTVKMEFENNLGTTSFYSDTGVTLALLWTTCIYAKARVENYSVSSYSIGDQSISVMDASREDSAQFQTWAESSSNALANSSSAGVSGNQPTNTSGYIG